MGDGDISVSAARDKFTHEINYLGSLRERELWGSSACLRSLSYAIIRDQHEIAIEIVLSRLVVADVIGSVSYGGISPGF